MDSTNVDDYLYSSEWDIDKDAKFRNLRSKWTLVTYLDSIFNIGKKEKEISNSRMSPKNISN